MRFAELAAGTNVRFKMADVVCPDPSEIIAKMTDGLRLTGRVVLLSDAGEKRNYFAVVEVAGVMCPLVVPVEQIETFDTLSGDDVFMARDY